MQTIRAGSSPQPTAYRRLLPVALAVLLLGVTAAGAALAQGSGTLSGTVTDSGTSAPLQGAVVLALGTQRSFTTGAEGNYSLSLPAGVYTVLITAPGYETVERQVTVTAGQVTTAEFSLVPGASAFGEEVVVLGSRAARTALETPVPVDVLPIEEMTQGGQTETSRMIQFLAPSFNFSTSTISDGTDIVRPSTLRGLGPDQTLVLVNGKRRHNSALVHVNGSVGRGTAGVDLNAIPASAIERVEILRDGAAAQYGSDAIAGVLNVVLKSDVDTTHVDITAGQYFEGDGEAFVVSVERGWRIGQGGHFNVSAEVRDRDFTNRAGPDPRQQFLPLPDGSPDPREATFDRLNHRYGDAVSDNLHLFFNSEIPLGPTADFYLFGGVSQRDGESAGFYRRALDARNVPEVHPEGFLPLINTEVDDLSLAVGVRKNFANWSLDASVTTGGNAFEFIISNSVNVSLGTASPTTARAGTLNFDQTTFNLDLFTTVSLGLSSPASLALGAELRRDSYEIEAGETASWVDGGVPDPFGGRAAPGIQVFPGFRPSNEVDRSRNNVAVYGDLEFNVTNRFLLALAARFEDYDDFGNNLSGKVAAHYELTDRFALRGSASTGFRAPSLHQAFFNNTSTQFVLNETTNELVPFEVGTFRNDSDIVKGLGVPELEEETSQSYSFGFTARPSRNLSITADVFRIDIDDRIVISGTFQAETDAAGNPVNGPIRRVLEPRGVNAAQFFTNAINTETGGVDLVIAYRHAMGPRSSLRLTGAANWNSTQVVGDVQTPEPLADLGATLFDRIERERIESAQPKQHYVLSGVWERQGWALLLRLNRFGSVKTVESASNPDLDQVFAAKWLTDIEGSYRFANGVRVAVGADNVFDVFPDENRPEISFNGIFVYPRRTAPFGFNGGYYYSRVSFDF